MTIQHLGLLLLAGEWMLRIGALALVPRHRSPQAAQSWLLFIFFVPIPAALIYALIGRARYPRWRRERFGRIAAWLSHFSTRLERQETEPALESELTRLARTVGGMPPTSGNRIQLLDDYQTVIDRLVEDIDGARERVYILTYIFADDAVGRRVIDALSRAHARGVVCHVLFDSAGSHHWARGTMRLLRRSGTIARAALPFHVVRRRTRGDMRNHRKLWVIDGSIGYIGSQNIVDAGFRRGVVNQELVVRAEGPVAAAMAEVFLVDWYMETEQLLEEPPEDRRPLGGGARAQLLPSGPGYDEQGYESLLVWQIHRAAARVTLTTPYFLPDEPLLSAIKSAVLRGVHVELIVSAIADQKLVGLAQRSYYEDLLAAGVHIHEYRDFLLHAKVVTIDETVAIIGSSNLDFRSFQLNEEVSLLLLDAAVVRDVAAIQRGYVGRSSRLDLAAWLRRPKAQSFAEQVARLLSPLL